MELERQKNILIIGHQAVLRAIYSYFMGVSHEKLPYVNIPLHTVIQLSPRPYGCEQKKVSVPIEAVDTHRPREYSGGQVSDISEGLECFKSSEEGGV
jgi:6-phosphofructo-2-kinase/fructose-2,6-biphosphatase 2